MTVSTKRYKMLLSVNADNKTVKGVKQGYLTGILYLAPYNLRGVNLCPNAENAGCINSCLYTAGRGAFKSTQLARINKTNYFNNDINNFMLDLDSSINKVIRKAKREGLIPVIRLNGTSDINWQGIRDSNGLNVFNRFPLIQFYDYTKIPSVSKQNNYHITFSYSGEPAYTRTVEKALRLGMNIAVVFRSKQLPKSFLDLQVVNGDNSDLRFLDKKTEQGQAVIIGLYAKGRAKKDNGLFVVDNTRKIEVKMVEYELPYVFDLLYDIKTLENLEQEYKWALNKVSGLTELINKHNINLNMVA